MREREQDGGTVAAEGLEFRVSYGELEALFDMHYESILRAQMKVTKPGLLCLGFDLGSAQMVVRHWFKTRNATINAVTIGRHSQCDICLPRDPTISLRHLLLVSQPFTAVGPNERIAFRLLDLHTRLGFCDCFGNRLQGVLADGPTLLSLGRYVLLILPTGSSPLPRQRRQAWDVVADPLYLEQHTQMLQSSVPRAAGGAGDYAAERARVDDGVGIDALRLTLEEEEAMNRTSFTIVGGPQRPGRALLLPSEDPLGTLEVSARGQTQSLVIGPKALEQGLLFGYYDRCDDACLSHLSDRSISRVHLVLMRQEDGVYAIDTASTNGTLAEHGGRRVRVRIAKLSRDFDLLLADGRARLHWEAEDG